MNKKRQSSTASEQRATPRWIRHQTQNNGVAWAMPEVISYRCDASICPSRRMPFAILCLIVAAVFNVIAGGSHAAAQNQPTSAARLIDRSNFDQIILKGQGGKIIEV